MLLQKGKIAFVNKKLNRFRSHSASTRINKGVEGWKSYFSEQFLVLHYLQQHACCDCADEFQKCVEALHAYITLNCRLKGFFKTCNCTEIVIYGAGGIGRHICNLLQDSFGHIRVIGFIDRMATQHPKLQVNGIPVMTLQGFINMKKDIPICIGSIIYAEEIEALLMGNGLGEKILKIVEIDKIR
jgi:FlaA1/EpsC-like NDP-sugar epimerase